MGWWNAGTSGGIQTHETGMIWGDEPADILDKALEKIAKTFMKTEGRLPTNRELRAGLEFSLPEEA